MFSCKSLIKFQFQSVEQKKGVTIPIIAICLQLFFVNETIIVLLNNKSKKKLKVIELWAINCVLFDCLIKKSCCVISNWFLNCELE